MFPCNRADEVVAMRRLQRAFSSIQNISHEVELVSCQCLGQTLVVDVKSVILASARDVVAVCRRIGRQADEILLIHVTGKRSPSAILPSIPQLQLRVRRRRHDGRGTQKARVGDRFAMSLEDLERSLELSQIVQVNAMIGGSINKLEGV